MKIIYNGKLPIKNADLAFAGIFKASEVIYHGTIFEIPDDNQVLIRKILSSGNYSEYVEPPKVERPKRKEKEIKEEK